MPNKEYFSDGVSEDIITDLSKVSALFVVARNTAFTFKGKALDVIQLARQLNVSHILEGSVRKAEGRVRISAQLIDGATGGHIWADRWDRSFTDIFVLQDEISRAVVAALELELLPAEKRAIGQRGTDSAEAYSFYLMARSQYVRRSLGDPSSAEAMLRLARRATDIDPNYARAWVLMAKARGALCRLHGIAGPDGQEENERALSIDPDLAEAHGQKATRLGRMGSFDEAVAEIELALRLDPESYEVNMNAAALSYGQRRFEDAIGYFEKLAALEADPGHPAMLIDCYSAIGDAEGVRRAARLAVDFAEAALALDPNNVSVMGNLVTALAALGQSVGAREWIDRAMLIDPDNLFARYNFACALSALADAEAALELLGQVFRRTDRLGVALLAHVRIDPSMDSIRDDPRFRSMLAAAEARLAAAEEPVH